MRDIPERNRPDRRFGAVYLTSISLTQVRCFGPEQRLNLVEGDRAAKWTVILGENGVGKTTVLQCAWALTPLVRVPIPGSRIRSHPRGFRGRLNLAELRRSASSAASIHANMLVGQPLTSGKTGRTVESSIDSIVPFTESMTHSHADLTNAPCCGYGALRRSGEAAAHAYALEDSATSLFSGDATLISGSEWLLRADYAARATPHAEAPRDKIRDALIALLPDVTDLRIVGLDEQPPGPRVDVRTPYGWVAMRSLSLGYRTLIAWIVDLAIRMFDAYPDSPEPLTEPAIALVDEIDLHRHPRWQREIMAHLDRLFPNVQFIVTAHSPLVAHGAGVTNVVVLRRVEDHVEIVNDPDEVRRWRIDQTLASDLFGASRARSAELE